MRGDISEFACVSIHTPDHRNQPGVMWRGFSYCGDCWDDILHMSLQTVGVSADDEQRVIEYVADAANWWEDIDADLARVFANYDDTVTAHIHERIEYYRQLNPELSPDRVAARDGST